MRADALLDTGDPDGAATWRKIIKAIEVTMDELVNVRRHPADQNEATYRVSDVHEFRFDSVTGGVGQNLSHDALCGYVWCDGMIEGELAHSCRHGPPPHWIKVVIPKVCNDPKLWAKLAGQEYREPKPLDMSLEAVEKRKDRAVRSAQTRAANRALQVETLALDVNANWPEGRLPSADTISGHFDVPRAIARDARRKASEIRKQ